MNKVILIGRLARDPEVRYTHTGKAVTSFSVAVDRFGGQNKETDFIPVVTWDKLAENCGNFLSKGQKVAVEGRLQVRSYETQDGQKRRVSEVVAQTVEFLERKQQQAAGGSEADLNGFSGDVIADSDDIPF